MFTYLFPDEILHPQLYRIFREWLPQVRCTKFFAMLTLMLKHYVLVLYRSTLWDVWWSARSTFWTSRLVQYHSARWTVTGWLKLFLHFVFWTFDIRFVFGLSHYCPKIFLFLYISHPEHARVEERWKQQLHTSEPVVAIASHPTNDYLLAGTQVSEYSWIHFGRIHCWNQLRTIC